MSLLDLSRTRRLFYGAQELGSLRKGPELLWARQLPRAVAWSPALSHPGVVIDDDGTRMNQFTGETLMGVADHWFSSSDIGVYFETHQIGGVMGAAAYIGLVGQPTDASIPKDYVAASVGGVTVNAAGDTAIDGAPVANIPSWTGGVAMIAVRRIDGDTVTWYGANGTWLIGPPSGGLSTATGNLGPGYSPLGVAGSVVWADPLNPGGGVALVTEREKFSYPLPEGFISYSEA